MILKCFNFSTFAPQSFHFCFLYCCCLSLFRNFFLLPIKSRKFLVHGCCFVCCWLAVFFKNILMFFICILTFYSCPSLMIMRSWRFSVNMKYKMEYLLLKIMSFNYVWIFWKINLQLFRLTWLKNQKLGHERLSQAHWPCKILTTNESNFVMGLIQFNYICSLAKIIDNLNEGLGNCSVSTWQKCTAIFVEPKWDDLTQRLLKNCLTPLLLTVKVLQTYSFFEIFREYYIGF